MKQPLLIVLAMLAASAASASDRYLSGRGVDVTAVLPPAPAEGSAQSYEDRAVFLATRRLAGSDRWRAAVSDVDMTPQAMLRDFGPASGLDLAVVRHPALDRLLAKMRVDVAAAIDAARPGYARRRPFLLDAGETCQPRAELAGSFDYPSGHSAWGYSVALVLAELLPSRSEAILARGREYGDSRVVCGMHNRSTVEMTRVAAAAIVAVLHGQIDFRSDLDQARAELNAPIAR